MTDAPLTGPPPTNPRAINPHVTTRRPGRLRPANLIVGLAFCLIAASWLVARRDLLTDDEVGTAVAVGLIVLGTLGVVATLVAGRRARPAVSPASDHAPETIETPAREEGNDDEEATGPQR